MNSVGQSRGAGIDIAVLASGVSRERVNVCPLSWRQTVRLPRQSGGRIVLVLNSVVLVRKRTIPTERPQPLVGEVVPTFADRECRVVSAADSHGR
jgi:hypothetical protein